MKSLKSFGFFPNEPSAQAEESLRQLTQKQADPQEDRMVAYLEAGHEYAIVAEIAIDLLDSQHPVICVPNVCTDGEWAWTTDVVYYLKKYHIRLPAEFVATMERNNWVVPVVEDFSEFELA